MPIPREIKRVHLVGIGGAAMSALAAMIKQCGIQVTGSDRGVYPPMSDFLAEKEIPVFEGYRPENLDGEIDRVVIGNALSRGNPEVEAILDRGLHYLSLPEAVRRWFIRGKRSFVVTGTHGKTTTASLLSWLLDSGGRDPSFMIGGIPKNYSSGYRLGDGDDFVMEGDEYDTAFFDKRAKFLHYLPRIATLGAVEFDHADIYADVDQIMHSFRLFLRVIPQTGRLVINRADPLVRRIAAEAPCPVVTCGLEDPEAEWSVEDIDPKDGTTGFTLARNGKAVGHGSWSMPGRHNLINGVLALAAANEAGVPPESALEAMETFQGVKRRLERIGHTNGVLIYDDFAHHPTAIRASLDALREAHPENRIWAVLEPRSNTMRRSVFQDVLADAFASADRVIVGPIHRPDMLPKGERLDPERLVRDLTRLGKNARHIGEFSEIVETIRSEASPGDVIGILSNGGFGGIHKQLVEADLGK